MAVHRCIGNATCAGSTWEPFFETCLERMTIVKLVMFGFVSQVSCSDCSAKTESVLRVRWAVHMGRM